MKIFFSLFILFCYVSSSYAEDEYLEGHPLITKKEATAVIIREADSGDPDAMVGAGVALAAGIGIEKNVKKAEEYFKKALKAGNVEANRFLGVIYSTEYEDKIKAAKYFKISADNGDVTSQEELAKIYYSDEKLKDYALGFKYAEMAAKQGSTWGLFIVGMALIYGEKGADRTDTTLGKEYLLKVAKSDESDAQLKLMIAEVLLNSGNKSDFDNAIDIVYKVSGQEEDIEARDRAQELIKNLIQVGVEAKIEDDVDFNELDPVNKGIVLYQAGKLKEAFLSFKKGAEEGNRVAQDNLGLAYARGEGVEQNFELAAKWFKKSAEQGYSGGIYNLGVCYYDGNGIEQNYAKAAELFEKVANNNNVNAQWYLGEIYSSKGRNDIKTDFVKAFYWYKKAAQNGNPDSQYAVGLAYRYGNGVEQNFTEAAKWYEKAAEQGVASAQNDLGLAYHLGRGVEQDYKRSCDLFAKAAEQNEINGILNHASCYIDGLGVNADYDKAIAILQPISSNLKAKYLICYAYYYKNEVNEAKKWCLDSAETGNEEAAKILKELDMISR